MFVFNAHSRQYPVLTCTCAAPSQASGLPGPTLVQDTGVQVGWPARSDSVCLAFECFSRQFL